MAEFYELAQKSLSSAGYHHYEISNWAKPGHESRHNLKYWRREPYLGFGAGAHSFSGMQRWANAHDAANYVNSIEGSRLPMEQLESSPAKPRSKKNYFWAYGNWMALMLPRIEKDYAVSLASRFDPLASSGLLEWNGRWFVCRLRD